MKHRPEDQIHIEQLEIWARVGVSEAEREKPQRLTINLTLWLFPEVNDLNDDISKTADYSSVCTETKKFVQDEPRRLIETLADAIAMFLLKRFAIRQAKVEVRKFVLPDAAYAAVTVIRTAAPD